MEIQPWRLINFKQVDVDNGKVKLKTTIISRSLLDSVDIPGDGNGSRSGLLCTCRMFVRELIEHARTKGIEEIYLLTTTATSFFAKIGFEKVDRHIVPPAIQNTSQFVSLCPDSATCLRQVLLQRSL